MTTKTITLAAALLALTAGAATAQGMPKADANGDGKVTLAEFKTARVAMMMRADTNKDGKVSKAELEAFGERKGGESKRAGGGGRMFGMVDANNDGFLTKPEVEKMVERRFQRMDVNGDGSLSAAELQSGKRGPMGGQGGGAD
jgi:Ca2+-binding EF-hand superfamily protein